jgi:alkylhydroperoxidase family enzyme
MTPTDPQGWDGWSGRRLAEHLSPDPAEVLETLWATSPVSESTTALIRRTCAETVGLAGARDHLVVDGEPVIVEMATQFATDVSATSDDLRARFGQACGRSTFETVQALFVADMVPRVRAALDALAGATEPWADEPPVLVEPAAYWTTIEALLREVHRLDRLDPVVTEVIRLHGARQHNCRLCRSIRSRPALMAGADEALFDAIDADGWDGLSERHRVALALTDAIIWHPASVPAELVSDVRREFTPAQAVEVVLDVMHNGANKIAVALAADAPNVTDGIEIYEIDHDGRAHYGLSV